MEGLHVVIKGVLHQYGFSYWNDLPGAVVIEHAKGLRQKERPHYHVWVPGQHKVLCNADSYAKAKPLEFCCYKHVLRHYYESLSPDLPWKTHGNSYYTVISHTSFDKWLAYTLREFCKEPKIEVWNRPEPCPVIEEPLQDLPLDDLLIPPQVLEPVRIIKEKKKDPAYKRFAAYVENEQLPTETITDVTNAWIEWTQGNYELRNVSGPIRYVYYTKHKGTPKGDFLKHAMKQEILDKFFSEYHV